MNNTIPLTYQEELDEKKRSAEEALRRNQEQLTLQRKKEEDLRKQINGIDPVEAERRAKHMREQRDMLLQKKKEERERKVRIESERRAKADAELAAELPQAVQRIKQQKADVSVRAFHDLSSQII